MEGKWRLLAGALLSWAADARPGEELETPLAGALALGKGYCWVTAGPHGISCGVAPGDRENLAAWLHHVWNTGRVKG